MNGYLYNPVLFYLITILTTFILAPFISYFNNHKKFKHFLFPLLLLGLSIPCITAITMIYSSHNQVLINDFWHRLFLFKMNPVYLMVILFLTPCILFLATAISLLFGYSRNQFSLAQEFSVMKGWAFAGIAIPLVLAPIIEELGWRGYGVDSLCAYFNLFQGSVLFGSLWALWHLPAFFIKGYYQNQLWHKGIIYVINFFMSAFIISILMNWVYYKTGRSIPGMILFHSVLNLSSIAFKTEQFTKCIMTLIFTSVIFWLVIYDKVFFFSKMLIL